MPPAPPPTPGRWRRTPPAIFPPVLGLFGLGLAWRAGAPAFGLPGGVAEMLLGAVTLLYLFCLAAWLAKPLRRSGVVLDELRVLPGRAGLAAMTLSLMLTGATLVPYAPRLALGLSVLGVAAHAALVATLTVLILRGPAEGRTVTPVWHMVFVGFIVAPAAWLPLGLEGAARAVLFATLPVAGAIWAVSLWQLATRIPPAPLRPLLAIHLAPASLFAVVATGLGHSTLAAVFAGAATLILIALLAAARWITAAGFSALWGAFTFPLAVYAAALLAVAPGSEALRIAAGLALVAATLAIPPIAAKVLQAWAKGGLAAKTNAAEA